MYLFSENFIYVYKWITIVHTPLPKYTSHPTTGLPRNFVIVLFLKLYYWFICVSVHIGVGTQEDLKRISDAQCHRHLWGTWHRCWDLTLVLMTEQQMLCWTISPAPSSASSSSSSFFHSLSPSSAAHLCTNVDHSLEHGHLTHGHISLTHTPRKTLPCPDAICWVWPC